MRKLNIYDDDYEKKDDTEEIIVRLEKQNIIMRETLEKYADETNWKIHKNQVKGIWYYNEDGYLLAKQVLKEVDGVNWQK